MLDIDRLTLRYPDWVGDYSLRVPEGALAALRGPSGGGKTTLLNAVAGFATPVSGRLTFRGQDLLPLPPAARPLSILFQEHNLFPHLTAAENVGLGLDPRLRLSTAQRAEAAAALDAVGLGGLGPRRPGELSGGQRQRVALARILVRRRPLWLLDEPFGALDPGLRCEMIGLVDAMRREQRATVVMSIHTPEEVAGVADMTVTIESGRVRTD